MQRRLQTVARTEPDRQSPACDHKAPVRRPFRNHRPPNTVQARPPPTKVHVTWLSQKFLAFLAFWLLDVGGRITALSPSVHTTPLAKCPNCNMPALDFMADDDGNGSADFDISSALLGSGKRAAGKRRAAPPMQGADDGDDDDAAFISAAMSKQNKKAGTEVAKRAVASTSGKGKKNKVASGTITGGGSFQSMGELDYLCILFQSLT